MLQKFSGLLSLQRLSSLTTRHVAFFLKFTGDVGGVGSPGPQGPTGPQGTVGPQGPGLLGVSYNRWGRTNCSGDAITVYTGKDLKVYGVGGSGRGGGGGGFLIPFPE